LAVFLPSDAVSYIAYRLQCLLSCQLIVILFVVKDDKKKKGEKDEKEKPS